VSPHVPHNAPMEIHKGLLEGVPFVQSPNIGGALKPEAIILHYTAGPSLTRAVATLTSPRHRASANVVVGPDGRVTQLVSFNRQAWHAGTSVWDGRPSLNKWSVGIEMVNPGWLKRKPVPGGHAWFTWWGDLVPDADVIVCQHKHGGKVLGWRVYPEAQIAATYAVCAALCDKYPDIRLLLGHDDIAPGRKHDPGPAFPIEKLRGWLGLGPGTDPA
jgi:N-acetylmuramoyl-L-alanine amidase